MNTTAKIDRLTSDKTLRAAIETAMDKGHSLPAIAASLARRAKLSLPWARMVAELHMDDIYESRETPCTLTLI